VCNDVVPAPIAIPMEEEETEKMVDKDTTVPEKEQLLMLNKPIKIKAVKKEKKSNKSKSKKSDKKADRKKAEKMKK